MNRVYSLRRDRRGWLIPLVLLCAMLLGGNLFLFQFVSSSDYSQVRRLTKTAQAAALADIASDEAFVLVGDAVDPKKATGSGVAVVGVDWISGLLEKLEAARAAAGCEAVKRLDVLHVVDFREKLAETLAAADQAGGGIEVLSAEIRAGPFDVIPGAYSCSQFYSEPLFGDGAKDPRPWDLKAPFTVDVSIRVSRGDVLTTQRHLRTQELAVTDTSAPAAEFAVFNYLPPPDQAYALNDLQEGGRLTIYPFDTGRVMVRGPLLLEPEDAAESPQLGGSQRPEKSLNYPVPGATSWTGWGAVPGPRAMQHPFKDLENTARQALNVIVRLFRDDPLFPGLGPRRPSRDSSPVALRFGPLSIKVGPLTLFTVPEIEIKLSLLISAGLEHLGSFYWPLNDDNVSYFPSGVYNYGPAARGKQTFSILGSTAFVPDGGGSPTSASMFRGARMAGDGTPSAFDGGLAALSTLDTPEGERIVPEPLPPASESGPVDRGVLAFYKTARFDSWTVFSVSAADVLVPLVCFLAAGPVGAAACETVLAPVRALGLDPTPRLQARNYELLTAPPATGPRDHASIEQALDDRDGFVVPYALYRHNDDFWSLEHLGSDLYQAVKDTLLQAVCETIGVPRIGAMLLGREAVPAMAQGARVLTRNLLETLETKLPQLFRRRWLGDLALEQITGLVDDRVRTVLEGAFRPYPPPAPETAVDAPALSAQDSASYPRGFYPPLHREWERVTTREFPDLETYLEADAEDGVLELRGAVLIRKLDYQGAPIRYRGRGILVALTADATRPSRLAAIVEPETEAEGNHLTIAHRVSSSLLASRPPLILGEKFVGSVYSDTGVAPAGTATLIVGNLVTGLLNKKGIPASLTGPADGVSVVYAKQIAKDAGGSRLSSWSLDLVGEISSGEPEK